MRLLEDTRSKVALAVGIDTTLFETVGFVSSINQAILPSSEVGDDTEVRKFVLGAFPTMELSKAWYAPEPDLPSVEDPINLDQRIKMYSKEWQREMGNSMSVC